MKYFNKACRILLLLLPFIFTLQEVYADNSSSTDTADNQQLGTSGLGSLGSNFFLDKINRVIKSIENLILFRSKKYEEPKNKKDERESEGVTYSFFDYDNKYEEPLQKRAPRNTPHKSGKSKKGE